MKRGPLVRLLGRFQRPPVTGVEITGFLFAGSQLPLKCKSHHDTMVLGGFGWID